VSESPHDFIAIFSHGLVLRGLLWQWFRDPQVTRTERLARLDHIRTAMGLHWLPYTRLRREGKLHHTKPMHHYLWFTAVAKIPNCALLKCQISDGRFTFQEIYTDHIPPELKGGRWQDR
jgi:hypothetical protein